LSASARLASSAVRVAFSRSSSCCASPRIANVEESKSYLSPFSCRDQ
jgi:hypothetical protein